MIGPRLQLAPGGMLNVYDIAYHLGLYASAPYWLLKSSARKKVLGALKQRMGLLPASGANQTRQLGAGAAGGDVHEAELIEEGDEGTTR